LIHDAVGGTIDGSSGTDKGIIPWHPWLNPSQGVSFVYVGDVTASGPLLALSRDVINQTGMHVVLSGSTTSVLYGPNGGGAVSLGNPGSGTRRVAMGGWEATTGVLYGEMADAAKVTVMTLEAVNADAGLTVFGQVSTPSVGTTGDGKAKLIIVLRGGYTAEDAIAIRNDALTNRGATAI
jgi:hypothetical protein